MFDVNGITVSIIIDEEWINYIYEDGKLKRREA